MITIPGWLFIVLAGFAIALLGAANGAPMRPGAQRILCWMAAADGVVLVILGLLVAAST